MTKEQNDRPVVFITIRGGVTDYVVSGDVDVHLIDWDNYRDLSDFTIEDLTNRIAEIGGMQAPTTEITRWKAQAIGDLATLIADKIEADAEGAGV